MSHLDQRFTALASRELPVAQSYATEATAIEPGWVHPVRATDERVTFAIALHSLLDVVGKRIALKVTRPAESPGEWRIYAPAGQLIEADDGQLNIDSVSEIGVQALGAYREWVCDPDGNWLMVRRIGGVSAGDGGETDDIPFRIVIKGTPITVQGVPLVNTPPTAARPALPVTIAKPAQIVPRAPLVPVVRAPVPTIELEDAFADASLEMDAEGDQFRVATALQELVEGRVLLDFTLRATSVSSTDFEEIGVQRFDPTGFEHCTLRLVAELDVAAFGQVVELQLVDLNTGTEVATLSTDKTLTTLCTAALVLPSEVTLYSVRLRRIGGNATLRVACRSVALELTNA